MGAQKLADQLHQVNSITHVRLSSLYSSTVP